MQLHNEKTMWKFASEIINSNIMEKLEQTLFSYHNNNNYKIITDAFGKANCKRMPYKLVKFKKHKHTQWITNCIHKSMKCRDNLHNQLKRLNLKTKQNW